MQDAGTFTDALGHVISLWIKHADRFVESGVTIVLTLLASAGVIWLMGRVTDRMLRRLAEAKGVSFDATRASTLGPLLRSIQRYLISFIALIIVLRELGVDTSALLASAGVLGLAVGFGAQNVVKDFISGVFLIFDGLVAVGDIVTVSGVTGTVEKVDLRNTLVREFGGQLWTFPNGDIRVFGNFNREWTRAVVTVGVAYEQDARRGMQVLKDAADAYAAEHPDLVLEPPEVQGVLSFDDSSVGLRVVLKVKPQRHWEVERSIRTLVKERFDEQGVEIPFPRRVIYTQAASDASRDSD